MKILFVLLFIAFPKLSFSMIFQSVENFAVTTASAKVLSEDRERKYLLIQNNGTKTVYVKINSVHSGNEGVQIVAGGNYEPWIAPVNSIYVKTDASTSTVTVVTGK